MCGRQFDIKILSPRSGDLGAIQQHSRNIVTINKGCQGIKRQLYRINVASCIVYNFLVLLFVSTLRCNIWLWDGRVHTHIHNWVYYHRITIWNHTGTVSSGCTVPPCGREAVAAIPQSDPAHGQPALSPELWPWHASLSLRPWWQLVGGWTTHPKNWKKMDHHLTNTCESCQPNK